MKKINFVLLTILLSSLVFLSCSETPKYDEPTQLISTDLGRLLNNNYNETRHRLISSSIQKEDANSAWYSIKELENYINYIKQQGKQKGYKVDGIRFYLGAYPETREYNEKAGLTTIFLSPTGKRVDVQKGSVINLPAVTQETLEENTDIEEIEPMNFGTMGHPPKIIYPLN